MSSLRQLGRYRIESFKGSRGEADAYRAFDMIRKRTVLLLALKPETAADELKLRRILHAAQSASELVHPRLEWVWETGAEDGVVYVAGRFVNGPSLRERLDQHGALSWEEASQALEQLAQGLDFLHAQGRVHGALRPENILLSPEVGAVLGGLAIPEAPPALTDDETAADAPPTMPQAQAEGEAQQETAAPARRAPAAARYTAPEVWMGEAPSAFSDQYALACVLAEMLTGKPLFEGATAAEICERSLEGATLPAAWPPGTPWQIEPTLERALAQQPAERFASAGEFAAAPERLAARPPSNEEERRQRETQRQARLEAELQARRQVEEAARLAALERARLELEEQVRRQSELQAQSPPPEAAPEAQLAAAAALEALDGAALEGRRRRAARARPASAAPARPKRRLLVWAGAAVLLLALAWAWGSGMLSGGGAPPTPASSPTPAVTQPAALPPAASPTQSATRPPTDTARPAPSSTPRPTASATRTPTLTLTPTETVRPTLPRTPTRTMQRPEVD